MLKIGSLLVLLFAVVSPVHAKDVSAQQVGVEYARENLEKAETEHKDNLRRVADSEKNLADAQKRLVEAQKRLADDKKKAEVSKKNVEEAQAKHARAQELLDQAWKK